MCSLHLGIAEGVAELAGGDVVVDELVPHDPRRVKLSIAASCSRPMKMADPVKVLCSARALEAFRIGSTFRCGWRLMSKSLSVTDGERGLNEGRVGECLRIVAEMVAGDGIDFLREEAERARELEEGREAIRRLADPSGRGQCLDQPECTGQERALGAVEPVMSGRIPVEERATSGEFTRDSVDRAPNPR